MDSFVIVKKTRRHTQIILQSTKKEKTNCIDKVRLKEGVKIIKLMKRKKTKPKIWKKNPSPS